MTSTDRLAEMAAEIERLRARITELETKLADFSQEMSGAEFVERLRLWYAEIEKREANAAMTFGTLAQPTPDEPTTITHDIPPNAPR